MRAEGEAQLTVIRVADGVPFGGVVTEEPHQPHVERDVTIQFEWQHASLITRLVQMLIDLQAQWINQPPLSSHNRTDYPLCGGKPLSQSTVILFVQIAARLVGRD